MKIIAKICVVLTLVSMILIGYTFVHAGESFTEALIISLMISSPLILLCAGIIIFDYFAQSLKQTIFYYFVLGSFVGCLYFHIDYNLMMLFDVLNKGSLGPAQGYWLLILVFGSPKPIVFGGALGLVIYFCLSYKTANKPFKKDK